MKGSRVAYTIESFRTAPSLSTAGYQLTVSGWFHAESPTKSMSLELQFDHPLKIDVTDFELPSEDVEQYFGKAAAKKRFTLVSHIGASFDHLKSAFLWVHLASGDRYAVDIKEIFEPHIEKTALTPSEIVMRFESLGDNCEFGLMQRAVGAERLGLFRYAGTKSALALAAGINSGFAGFGTRDDLEFHLAHGEWIGASLRYGYVFHTRRYEAAMMEDAIRAEESGRLPFLARLLLEDIEDGNKIFVRRVGYSSGTDVEAGMHALHKALRALGPSKLLWVSAADISFPPGHVIHLGDGLFRGYIDRLSPYEDALDFSVAGWLTLLSATLSLIEALEGSALPDLASSILAENS